MECQHENVITMHVLTKQYDVCVDCNTILDVVSLNTVNR
jgi:hypothetical protein